MFMFTVDSRMGRRRGRADCGGLLRRVACIGCGVVVGDKRRPTVRSDERCSRCRSWPVSFRYFPNGRPFRLNTVLIPKIPRCKIATLHLRYGGTYNVDVHAAVNVIRRREGQAHPAVRAGEAARLVVAHKAHLS